jgi:hypothetical protein
LVFRSLGGIFDRRRSARLISLVGRNDWVGSVLVEILLGRDDQGRLVQVNIGQSSFGILLLGRRRGRRGQGEGRNEGRLQGLDPSLSLVTLICFSTRKADLQRASRRYQGYGLKTLYW